MRFIRGDDYWPDKADMKAFGITDTKLKIQHTNKIEVYDDRALRDRILVLLNEDEEEDI